MYDVGTIDFAVYEDADEFLGIANAPLPSINSKVITINGAGILGDVDVPVLAHLDAMETSLAFRNYTTRLARLHEYRRHVLELRVAQQAENPALGALVTDTVKYVMGVVPKSVSGGTVTPATPLDSTIAFSVRYLAMYVNGEKVTEIDQLNGIYIINGIDYYSDVRKALGK
jgi:P2 family phage contractile tail tube protein